MKNVAVALALAAALLFASTARAHFGMLIPSDSMVTQHDSRMLTVKLSFSHPFEQNGMDLEKPAAFGVVVDGRKVDLRDRLTPAQVLGHAAWQAVFPLRRPGVYAFYMVPKPYWEPAEDIFIVHYTKTVISAFGDDENWGQEIGLKTEIVPLSRPFGLYAGNVFQGIVKIDAKPVPYAEVEVEYDNSGQAYRAPTDLMVTQRLKADGSGVFTYAVPWPGWWGFAALNNADFQLKHNDRKKDVELGAVIWVRFLKPLSAGK